MSCNAEYSVAVTFVGSSRLNLYIDNNIIFQGNPKAQSYILFFHFQVFIAVFALKWGGNLLLINTLCV